MTFTKLFATSLILSLVLSLGVVLSAPRSIFAECGGPYGDPDDCPFEVDIVKEVRLQSQSGYVKSLTGVLDEQLLVYRIIVTNQSSRTITDLSLQDFIIDPSERDNIVFVSSSDVAKNGDKLVAQIPSLNPGESRSFLYTSRASAHDIVEGSSLKVENEVDLIKDGEVIDKDLADVTIKRGEVLAAELPATGAQGVFVASGYALYLGVLLRKLKITKYW